ncbi:MAG: hypothetical protein KIPDCIKN_04266 [Haliscomenobacter sp.]|nr:hypothetical protein [Haliscomenobacter sp.]
MPWHLILPFFFLGLFLGIRNTSAFFKTKTHHRHARINDL